MIVMQAPTDSHWLGRVYWTRVIYHGMVEMQTLNDSIMLVHDAMNLDFVIFLGMVEMLTVTPNDSLILVHCVMSTDHKISHGAIERQAPDHSLLLVHGEMSPRCVNLSQFG